MSILIKGLKIPKNCCECFAFKTNASGMMFCRAGKTAFEKEDAEWLPLRVSDHCPLIELPDHGDLKDVNAIIQDVHDDIDRMTKIGIAVDADWIWAKFHNAIYSAPVVIPAERTADLCDACGKADKENCSYCEKMERSEEDENWYTELDDPKIAERSE